MIIDSLLTQHHVERMDILQGETIVGCCSLSQIEHIAALASRKTLSVVRRETWERLHECGRVREICTKLSADSQILNRINLCIHSRENLILLVLDRILCHIYDRVLARTSPVACCKRSKTAILCVWIPIWKHEAAS